MCGGWGGGEGRGIERRRVKILRRAKGEKRFGERWMEGEREGVRKVEMEE
jgi:hypothetical protein